VASTIACGEAEASIVHGGRIGQARRRFPGAPEPFIDLSTGINPVPYPVPALPTASFARLPEPEALETLQEAAARAYGVADPAMVVAAPGTQILIDLLPRLWPMRRVCVLGPTYAEHEAAWKRAGTAVVGIRGLDQVGDAEILVVCNPNNPDGHRIPPPQLLALADRLAGRRGLLVVDEAFGDLEPEGSSLAPFLPHPAPYPGIVILRSFGKTYGLAGLRLGFALAAPERAAEIRTALGPWAVSGPALLIGAQALADRGWLEAARRRLEGGVARLDRILCEAGLGVIGGTLLFRLAQSASAATVFERLGRAGILVRRFDYRPDWLRFGLPGPETDWARLRAALASGQDRTHKPLRE
jgi:cobalamin biosynthetic protein CobC